LIKQSAHQIEGLLPILNLVCQASGLDLFQQLLEQGRGHQSEMGDEVSAGQQSWFGLAFGIGVKVVRQQGFDKAYIGF